MKTAQAIYDIAEMEMSKKGFISLDTGLLVKEFTSDFVRYISMHNGGAKFNLEQWKQDFM